MSERAQSLSQRPSGRGAANQLESGWSLCGDVPVPGVTGQGVHPPAGLQTAGR